MKITKIILENITATLLYNGVSEAIITIQMNNAFGARKLPPQELIDVTGNNY